MFLREVCAILGLYLNSKINTTVRVHSEPL